MANDNQNIWFGISMGLMGLIVGFVFATLTNSSSLIQKTGTQQVAQVPTPPNAPAPTPTPAPPAAPTPAGTIVPIDFERDHIRGNKDATIAIIEYSDFECPYCHRVHPTYKQIMAEYGDDVMWVYRHFPLTSIHPKAMPTAIASECAAEVGGNDAFWKFADMVVENQNYDYPAIGKSIGLNEKKFADCLAKNEYEAYVTQQETEGVAAGVNGTPGNIIYNVETKDSRLVPGARSFDMFKPDIDAMLEAA